MYVEIIFILSMVGHCLSKLPLEIFERLEPHLPTHKSNHQNSVSGKFRLKVFYQHGMSEDDLPDCGHNEVCSIIDLYGAPWVEKRCRCKHKRACSMRYKKDDGKTIVDKTRLFKLCETVTELPKCSYFRDSTWTITVSPNNTLEQNVHCICPKNSVTYMTGWQRLHDRDDAFYKYSFACSPPTKMRCNPLEPCRLFTVRKKKGVFEEANINNLCVCQSNYHCPRHHGDHGAFPFDVAIFKVYPGIIFTSYKGYCVPHSA